MNSALFCPHKYLSALMMTHSALNSSIPVEVISIYPENTGFMVSEILSTS